MRGQHHQISCDVGNEQLSESEESDSVEAPAVALSIVISNQENTGTKSALACSTSL
jgi:hypothetical protein